MVISLPQQSVSVNREMNFRAAALFCGWREPKLLKYGWKFRLFLQKAWIAIVRLNLKLNNRREGARVAALAARPSTRLPPGAG
jgi:hypothetical protein